MRLSDALRIHPGYVVAFVGAGGKSTAIRRLAIELIPQAKVVITTTTKIALDQVDLAEKHIILDSDGELESVIETTHPFESILVTGHRDELEPKWLGLGLGVVEELIQIVRRKGWVLLVEADGARGSSLKAPARYEPVLPSTCDVVVPVVGLDVIGEDITSAKIHRAEILKGLLDLEKEERIGTQHLVDILTSRKGGLKNILPSTTVRVLLNKADADEDLRLGYQVGQALILDERIQSVLLASVVEEIPVKRSICRVAGIILAAGASTRVEGLKQLISFRNKPLVAHAVEAALGAGLAPVVVVGREEERLQGVLKEYPIQFATNFEPERGQSSSVKVGLEAVQDWVDAAIFLLADMPLVTFDLVKALVERQQLTLSPVIAPFAGSRRGNPVLFDRQTFDDLWQLEGDQGGRAIFSRYPVERVEWDDSILMDIDSEEDLQRLREIE